MTAMGRLLLTMMILTGCSSKPSPEGHPVEPPEGKADSTGSVVGTAQIALRSGDVKNLAFTTVKLVQQDFRVLTDSEKEDISVDLQLGLNAVRLGMMTHDELERKINNKSAAMDSFESRLPQKAQIPAVATTTTDANGRFRFDRVQAGTYRIFLDTKIGMSFIGWSVPADVKPGETVMVDLNNTDIDYSWQ